MADVALRLGPYMSVSSRKHICTRTPLVHKRRRIITNHQSTERDNHDDPQIPQPDLRFAKKQQSNSNGARAQTATPTKGFAMGHSDSYHCVAIKNMQVNCPLRPYVKRLNRRNEICYTGLSRTMAINISPPSF